VEIKDAIPPRDDTNGAVKLMILVENVYHFPSVVYAKVDAVL
jgi:hypothetical protein